MKEYHVVRGSQTLSDELLRIKLFNLLSPHESNQPHKCYLVIIMFPNRIRVISSPQLNTLLCVHLDPINVIVSYDPSTNTYLEVGFPLRCFQRLSIPDIATGRSGWRQSPHTRGQFTPVLSY